MKKNNFVLLTLFLFLISCADTASKFSQTNSGLRYRFYKSNIDNPKPIDGDVLTVELACVYNDSLLFKSSNNFKDLRIVYNNSENNTIVNEAFSLMHKGDSIALLLPADSVLKILGIDKLPIYIAGNEIIELDIKLVDFISQEELKAELEQKYIESSNKLIEKYINGNKINVEPFSSGLYYIENIQGSGSYPEFGEKVFVSYVAKLLDETVVDDASDTVVEIVLGKNQIFPGMEEGIMNMRKGGKATLIIPFDLAFGKEGSSLVPPYSPLCIDIVLVDIIDKAIVEKEDELKAKASVLEAKRIFDNYIVENNLTNNLISEGISYRIITNGSSESPTQNSKVKVHYVGKLIDGTIFDSSYDRNQPFEFTLGKGAVLPGWDIAVSKMKLGEKAEFVMSQELVYRDYSLGMIKPYSNLIYEIELIDIE